MTNEVHAASDGSYGAKRVHAELVLGRGITVGHNAVAVLMQRAGIKGRNGARRWRGVSVSRPRRISSIGSSAAAGRTSCG